MPKHNAVGSALSCWANPVWWGRRSVCNRRGLDIGFICSWNYLRVLSLSVCCIGGGVAVFLKPPAALVLCPCLTYFLCVCVLCNKGGCSFTPTSVMFLESFSVSEQSWGREGEAWAGLAVGSPAFYLTGGAFFSMRVLFPELSRIKKSAGN